MNKIDYQALRAKAEKATCGEWSLEYGEGRFDGDDALIHREAAGYIPICRIEGAHPESGFDEDFQMEQQANAEFIAAANPATVLALLDELGAAEKRIAELESLKAPQLPQQAVPAEMPEPDTARMFFTDAVVAIAKVQGWNSCRAAMLQGANVSHTHEGKNHPEDKLGMVNHLGDANEKVNSPVTPDAGTLIPMSLGLRAGGALAEGVAAQLARTGESSVRRAAATAVRATPDIAYAAGTNIAFGMAQRGLTAKTLRDGGYSEMANQYDVLDRQAIAIDAVLGVAFGGVGRFINSRGESTNAPNFSPVDIDAALAANAAHHAEIDIAPGVPINVLSRNSHIQALRKAMSDVSQGRPVDVASIVESASFSEIPGRKSLLSQAVNEALSSVDDGVTARAIENRLLEEQAAQLLPRGDRQVYQSEIANSQRIIENLTEQRAQILAEEPTGSGKALSRARSDKQARLRDIDQRIRQAQERLEFSRNALAPHEPGGQFFEARAELARRQQAESELNAQAVSFYKTAEVRTPDEVAPFEPDKILQQAEQKMMSDPAGDIDLRIAEDSLLESPDMIITVLDDDGNPQSRSAREVLDEANRESEQAIQDSSLFDVAVACFLRG